MTYFGYCADGHMHGIKPQFVQIAKDKKSDFTSNMFTQQSYHEADISRQDFIRLEPTNCPNIEESLAFGLLAEPPNMLPNREALILPYDADQVDEWPPSVWLSNFEVHPGRMSETKQDGKWILFELIKQSLPELTDRNIESMTYESLREMFLRRFWNIKEQDETFNEFHISFYPSAFGQRASDYVYHWLRRLTFCTAYCTRDIIAELIQKVPPVCRPVLEPFVNGGKVNDVYEAVIENEHFRRSYDRLVRFERRRGGWRLSQFLVGGLVGVVGVPTVFYITKFFKFMYRPSN